MTADQHSGRRAIETGPTGKTVGRNITRLRKSKDLTTRQLSAELARLGRPIPASGITRMEQGERQVTVDDLCALASALRVNPSALLLPLTAGEYERVEVTGFGTVYAALAWQWADGVRPTPRADRLSETEHYQFLLLARPEGRRMLLPIQDPESPDWPAQPTPLQQLSGNEMLAHRRETQEIELHEVEERRRDVEALSTPEGRAAELDRLARRELEARGLLSEFEEKVRKIREQATADAEGEQ